MLGRLQSVRSPRIWACLAAFSICGPALADDLFDLSNWPHGPTVSLNFKDTALSTIVAALEKEAPSNVSFRFDIFEREAIASRRVAISVDRVPFWAAVAELSRASKCGFEFNWFAATRLRLSSNRRLYPVVRAVSLCKAGPGSCADGSRFPSETPERSYAMAARCAGLWNVRRTRIFTETFGCSKRTQTSVTPTRQAARACPHLDVETESNKEMG